MVTATVPIYDANKTFIGCVTSDINLLSLQEMITNIKVGKTGGAFLINKDGTYIAVEDEAKIMKTKITEEKNKDLAVKSSGFLKNPQGETTYKEGNTTYRLYYKTIPETNWVIGLKISEKEMIDLFYVDINSIPGFHEEAVNSFFTGLFTLIQIFQFHYSKKACRFSQHASVFKLSFIMWVCFCIPLRSDPKLPEHHL
jgi:hypothetical protein